MNKYLKCVIKCIITVVGILPFIFIGSIFSLFCIIPMLAGCRPFTEPPLYTALNWWIEL